MRKMKTLKCVVEFPKCPKCQIDLDDYATGESEGYCGACKTTYKIKVIYK